jgi:hypothetical protein
MSSNPCCGWTGVPRLDHDGFCYRCGESPEQQGIPSTKKTPSEDDGAKTFPGMAPGATVSAK